MQIRIRRGLDLPIPGAPVQAIEAAPRPRSVALLGGDHPRMRLSPAVEPGDAVALGQMLLRDARDERIRFTAPAAGNVVEVRRGEGRQLVAVVIDVRGDNAVAFPACDADGLARLDRSEILERLLTSGQWIALRERPFGDVPSPDTTPHAIFVRAMDTNPLAARAEPVLRGRGEDLRFGLRALAQLTDGPLFVCTDPETRAALPALEAARVVTFAGPHPAGLVGTHIQHLFPADAEHRVWYVGYQDVLAIGQLFRSGRIDPERVIALAGPGMRRPRLLRARMGASTDDLLRGELAHEACRIVSGSVLSGRRAAGPVRFLGRYHEQLCALREAEASGAEAWLVPGLRRGRRAPPWRRAPRFTTAQPAAPRAFLPLDVFDRVAPPGLLVGLLLRALAAGDAEGARDYGALALEEEDLALCTYLCPGKLEYGPLLRSSLDAIGRQLG